MPDIDVNAMIWRKFISATTKNTDFAKVKHLFDTSQTLIVNQKDQIFGISTIELMIIP